MLDLDRIRFEIERNVQPKGNAVESVAKGKLTLNASVRLPAGLTQKGLPERMVRQVIWDQAYQEPHDAVRALLHSIERDSPTATYFGVKRELVRILEMLTCR